MAKGQEIEELYISLGLNINDLKLGFDTAGKTVNQAITKLNNQNKEIQLKTDVDLSKLTGVGSELDKIKLKYGAFPDRPYDSKAVWGDSRKIEAIMKGGTKDGPDNG